MSSDDHVKARTVESTKGTFRRDKGLRSIDNNPCLKEQDMSLQCMSDHDYDRDKCMQYFANYKSCRLFWNNVQKDRRKQGIRPHLPPPEERDAVKADRLQFHIK